MEDYSNRIVDRLPEFDERSRLFAAIGPDDSRPFKSAGWTCDVYNDQGREGACVGFAWTHELAARPYVVRRDAAFALQIYNRAKQLDPWPGEDYDGTSVLAGVKAVMEQKNTRGYAYIREYRWAFGIQDVLRVVGWMGPVVLGINWHYDMYYPGPNGYIQPTGDIVGGHAILANGIKAVAKDPTKDITWDNLDIDKSRLRLHNSWGTGYGIGGDAFITVRNLDKLLQDDGEACIPVKRSYDR